MTPDATPTEIWTASAGALHSIERTAERVEAAGWDGLAVVDSQNIAGDSYVALTLAARATDRIGLGTAVTNPVTRHPAVTAAAISGVQVASRGRATLGIGRGDSSLAHLGRAPVSWRVLERYVDVLQRYLRKERVPFDALRFHGEAVPDVDALRLANGPTSSRLHWLDPEIARVPVEVAATGPKVIGVAARLADRVMFALGAEPERILWGVETARRARQAAGLDPAGLSFGAYVNAVSHPDLRTARALVRGGLTTFARFSVMHGAPVGPASEAQREVLTALGERYDMTRHTRSDSPQAGVLTDAFVDRYAVVGDADRCAERLRELCALGLSRIVVVGPSAGSERAEAVRAQQLFAEQVLPAVRAR